MWRVTIRGLLAKKLRLFTTALAVMLGVAFMSGTLVLTDTMGKVFDDLFADVNRGTDAFVRGQTVFKSDFGDVRSRIPASLVTTVQGADRREGCRRVGAGLRAARQGRRQGAQRRAKPRPSAAAGARCPS